MVEMKEVTARAVGIVERLAQYTAVEKAEILAIAQQIINVELARVSRSGLGTQTHLAVPSQAAGYGAGYGDGRAGAQRAGVTDE